MGWLDPWYGIMLVLAPDGYLLLLLNRLHEGRKRD